MEDQRADQPGRLTGAAIFSADGDALLYCEQGRLVIGGHDGPALQSYRYGFPATDRAQVFFSDGRFFHHLDLSAGAWQCTHLCGDDRYHGEFTALDADAWRVVWRVVGPRKDLVLDSRYRRRL